MSKQLTYPNFLIEQANKVYNVDVLEKTNKRDYYYARVAISYYLRKDNYSLQTIAKLFKKDHSTLSQALKKHDDNMQFDVYYKTKFVEFQLAISKPINQEEFMRLSIKKVITELLELNYTFDEIQKFWTECINVAKE